MPRLKLFSLQRVTFYVADCLLQPPMQRFKEPHVATHEVLPCFTLTPRRNNQSILRNM